MANNYNQNYDNSDVWFDVYGAEGDMQPEEMALRRKQAQIDACTTHDELDALI